MASSCNLWEVCLFFLIILKHSTATYAANLDLTDSMALQRFMQEAGAEEDGRGMIALDHFDPCHSSVVISCEDGVQISGGGRSKETLRATAIRLPSRRLGGVLSAGIGSLSELRELSLPGNRLHGRIPSQIGGCRKMEVLNLKSNRLSGEAPPEIASLTRLRVLDLSSNALSGDLSFLRNLPNLENLSLAHNLFRGNIPLCLRSLRNLQFLDLSKNDLHDPAGILPLLEQEIARLDSHPRRELLAEESPAAAPALPPASAAGRNRSGAAAPSPSPSPPRRKKRSKGKHAASILLGFFVGIAGGVISGAIFSSVVRELLRWWRSMGRRKHKGVKIFSALIKRVENLDFLQKEDCTAGLELIGRGGCGEVYKAELPESGGKMIAIKKIPQPAMDSVELTTEESKMLTKWSKQIKAEVQTVGQIRHRNLLPLLAHVCRPDCHLLVYELMENGSLQDALDQAQEGRRELDWPTRLKIAKGTAAGLQYLHMIHRPPIVHRDLKPANILLDDDMDARIADFGLAKAIPECVSHLTASVVGTLGYIAPEYHQTHKFTDKCDIYSFGVVLAALVVGKLPTDRFFQTTDELILVKWVRNVLSSEEPIGAIDPKLVGSGWEEQMILALKIACFCTYENPKQRPSSTDLCCMLSQLVDPPPVREEDDDHQVARMEEVPINLPYLNINS